MVLVMEGVLEADGTGRGDEGGGPPDGGAPGADGRDPGGSARSGAAQVPQNQDVSGFAARHFGQFKANFPSPLVLTII
jgi:hypothetical protein